MSYILHALRAADRGEKTLAAYAASGLLAITAGWIIRQNAIGIEAISLFLIAWILILIGTAIWFLAEALPSNSVYARNPIQFLHSRILLKLIFLFVLLLLILPEAAMIGAVHLNRNAITEEVHKNFSARAVRMAENLQSHFLRMEEDIQRAVQLIHEAPGLKASIVTGLFSTYPDMRGIANVDASGAIQFLETRAGESSGADWVGGRLAHYPKSGMAYVPNINNKKDGLSILARDPSRQYWLARVSFAFVENQILQNLVGGKGISFIVNTDGKILSHPDPELIGKGELSKVPLIQEGFAGTSVGEYTGTYDVRYAGAAAPIPILGWVAVVQEPVASAYADIQKIVNSNILLVVLTALVTVIAGILFAQSIEKPIREVIRGTEEVRKGNLAYVIPVKTGDEIGELAGAFNQMTRELRESQEHLIASEKLAALGTMAAGMAHEIKNPLVSLRTFTQLLQQKFADPEFRHKFSTIVPQEIEKINKIAENLLKFGRPSKPELKAVNVNEILEDVISLFENECRKHNIRITIKLAKLPEITGDPGQLSQAFINIILNAIQAMEGGGELTIKTDIGEVIRLGEADASGAVKRISSQREMIWGMVEKGSPRFPPAHHTPVIFVEVTDTGPGISEESLRNIFDPFFTTKAKGTGMGLPITLRIIEEHQGSVKVKSAGGKGTTFIITLPQKLEKKSA